MVLTAETVHSILLQALLFRDLLIDGVVRDVRWDRAVEAGVHEDDRVCAGHGIKADTDHRQRSAVVAIKNDVKTCADYRATRSYRGARAAVFFSDAKLSSLTTTGSK